MKNLVCALALALATPLAWGAAPDPMAFALSTGGAPVDPVASGGILYQPAGATVTAWSTAGATPLQVGETGTQPLDGYIVSAVVRGAYLYASFDAYDDVTGGGIEFVRVVSERLYGIPPEQVVGSSTKNRF